MSAAEGSALITPQTNPGHWVVGRLWKGWTGAIYWCDSFDPRQGYWMTNVADAQDRRNVSERAPTGSYHEVSGLCTAADLEQGTQLVAVHMIDPGVPLRPVTRDEARALAPPYFVFWDELYARQAKRRVQEAAVARAGTAPTCVGQAG